jgi:hypothetical protein
MRILFTSALISQDFDARKEEYLKGLESLKPFWNDTTVIECARTESPWISDKVPVYFTGVNNPSWRNKGANEANALLSFLTKHPGDPNQMVVKFTGRYRFKDSSFLDTCLTTKYDAVVKLGEGSQVYTACFAMREGLLVDMLKSIDFNIMEIGMVNFEQLVANYVYKKLVNYQTLGKLNITAPVFGTGNRHVLEL